MSTIALYVDKVNDMPELIGDIKTSVSNFTTELLSLKGKAVNINRSVCDLYDVIDSIQSSTQTQEDMSDSLDTFQLNTQNFISAVDYVDSIVSEAVEQNKDDFYEEYSYLKPDCEKSTGERIAEAIVEAVVTAVVSYINIQMDVFTWCREHWKLIAAVVLVVIAIVILVGTFGTAAPVLALICQGIIAGFVVGGTVGGAIGLFSGDRNFDSFLEGFEDGAFSGAIAGAITAGLGWAIAGGIPVTLTLGQTMVVGGFSNYGASVLGDLGDIFFAGEHISLGEIGFNASLSFLMGFGSARAAYGFGKLIPINFKGITSGDGNWADAWKSQTALTVGIKGFLRAFSAILLMASGTLYFQLFQTLCRTILRIPYHVMIARKTLSLRRRLPKKSGCRTGPPYGYKKVRVIIRV